MIYKDTDGVVAVNRVENILDRYEQNGVKGPKAGMKLSEIKEILKADVILGENKMEMILQAGAGSDLMSDLLRGTKSGVVVLSGLNTLQIIRTAVIAEVSAVVLVRDKKPEPEMIALARLHDLPLLSTPFTMFTACGRLFRQGLRGVEQKKSE